MEPKIIVIAILFTAIIAIGVSLAIKHSNKKSFFETAPPILGCPVNTDDSISSNGPIPNYISESGIPGYYNWNEDGMLKQGNVLGFKNTMPFSTGALNILEGLFNIVIKDYLPTKQITIPQGTNQTLTSCLNNIAVDQSSGTTILGGIGITVTVKNIMNILNHMSMRIYGAQVWSPPSSNQMLVIAELGIQAGITVNCSVAEPYKHYSGHIDITFCITLPIKLKLQNVKSGVEIIDLRVDGTPNIIHWDRVDSDGLPDNIMGLFHYRGKVGDAVQNKIVPKIGSFLSDPESLAKLKTQVIPWVHIYQTTPATKLGDYTFLSGFQPASVPGGMVQTTGYPCVNKGDYGCVVSSNLQDTDHPMCISFNNADKTTWNCRNSCGGYDGVHGKGCLCYDYQCQSSGDWCKGQDMCTPIEGPLNWKEQGLKSVMGAWPLNLQYLVNFKAYTSEGKLIAGPFNSPLPDDNFNVLSYVFKGNKKFPLPDKITFDTPIIVAPGTFFAQQ